MRTVASDRISGLSDFILHHVLSFLDTKAACRASVLSKRWYSVWSSIPVLDFQLKYFKDCHFSFKNDLSDDDDIFSDDIMVRYVEFINKTMQRYFTCKYRITKLYLELPKIDEKLKGRVDKWIEISVQNQIEELGINIRDWCTPYMLPEILFRAKSLKVLKCDRVELPYYETMELISLECLTLVLPEAVDDDMLQRIISFCPLVNLDLLICNGKNISLPWTRKVNEGAECFDSGMHSDYKVSQLTNFALKGLGFEMPCVWNVGALKNLKKLEIVGANITDDVVFELVYGLVALESLILAACSMLKCIKISSISLKDFHMTGNVVSAIVDAPNMLEFWYHGEVETSEETSLSLIRMQDHCNVYFCPTALESLKADWFVKLKKFLIETCLFKSLVIDVSFCDMIAEGVELLGNIVIGPPYKLRELKLLETNTWKFSNSLFMAFIDGLFWSCHPDVLCIKAGFESWNEMAILDILKSKVKCWKYPLISIEVEAVDYSRLLSESPEVEIRLRLSWSSI